MCHVRTFLGLEGSFPFPQSGMTLSIDHPLVKRVNWARMIDNILELGVATHSQLESLIGRLSFSQTSIFGRFGRPMISPLYVNLDTLHYHPILSDREIRVLQWWKTAITNLEPRTVSERRGRPGVVVFTDAATTTRIIAGVAIFRSEFKSDETVGELRSSVSGHYWATLFQSTNLI